jgi:hypothetical protein
MAQDIYKYAAKHKLTFNTTKGILNVSDLFDLKVEVLDKIYSELKKQEDSANTFTLLEKKTSESEVLEVKIAIVKDIVEDKLQAIETAKKAAETKAQNQKILEIIAKKKDEALEEKSIEELQAMIK